MEFLSRVTHGHINIWWKQSKINVRFRYSQYFQLLHQHLFFAPIFWCICRYLCIRIVEGVLFAVVGIFGFLGNLLSILLLSIPQVTSLYFPKYCRRYLLRMIRTNTH